MPVFDFLLFTADKNDEMKFLVFVQRVKERWGNSLGPIKQTVVLFTGGQSVLDPYGHLMSTSFHVLRSSLVPIRCGNRVFMQWSLAILWRPLRCLVTGEVLKR